MLQFVAVSWSYIKAVQHNVVQRLGMCLRVFLSKAYLRFTEKQVLATFPLIYLTCLFLIPSLIMVFIAFREPGAYGGVVPLLTSYFKHAVKSYHLNLSLDSFRFVLTSGFIWQLFVRSLSFSILTTACCLVLGYPLALLISTANKKVRDFVLLLVIIPFWSCFLVRVYAWMIILGPYSAINHLINYVVSILGKEPINLLYSSVAVVVCLVYINLPFMVLPLYAALEKHDITLIEASRDLGASRLQTFWKITFPLSLPAVLAGCALVFIPSIGMFVVPELVGNNCSLMIGNLIKQQFLQTMNWPLGSATAIIMTISILSLSICVGYIVTRYGGIKRASK